MCRYNFSTYKLGQLVKVHKVDFKTLPSTVTHIIFQQEKVKKSRDIKKHSSKFQTILRLSLLTPHDQFTSLSLHTQRLIPSLLLKDMQETNKTKQTCPSKVFPCCGLKKEHKKWGARKTCCRSIKSFSCFCSDSVWSFSS
jgi:hypothetical protein